MLEAVLVIGVLLLLYKGGELTPLGLAPTSPLGAPSTAQALSSTITSEEAGALQQSPNQVGLGYNQAAASASSIASGIGSGLAAGGPVGAALGGIQGAISSIFGGMKLRAQQATTENEAENYAVAAFDQAIQQINAAYRNGSIQPQEAIALVNQTFAQFWQVMTPKIQPNRNGCASGANCPGSALNYVASNGSPPGYCSGNIGGTCCIGCGPLRLSVERIIQVLQTSHHGTVVMAPVIGNPKYGSQTRLSYSLQW